MPRPASTIGTPTTELASGPPRLRRITGRIAFPTAGTWTDTTASERAPSTDLNGFAMIALVSFWLAFVALYTLRSILVGGNPLDNMLPRVLVAIYGACLSWAMYWTLERTRPRSIGGGMAYAIAVSVPTSIVFAVGHELIFTPLAIPQGPHCAFLAWDHCPQPATWTAIVDNAVNWTFLFSAWGLVQLAARSTLERWAADNRAGEHREATRVAEIRALRYQVNPHFLFNCLNSLATLVRRSEPDEAEEMIGELGAFLRYGLATDLLTDVELEDEVEMQQRYLALECRRFTDRLTVTIDLEPGTERARVPSLILQPLVENAIRHGVALTTARTTLAIRSRLLNGERVLITVEDDAWGGNDVPGGKGSHSGLAIGLCNVSARLAARFGSDAQFRTARMPIGGYRAEIEVPLMTA